jgi:predicted pyridoxine 5'-phosphate oxidase superfamily flavin-nucleotide-binding protein
MISRPLEVEVGMTQTGNFHEGELAVQQLAGVSGQAARLSRMLAAPRLDGGIGAFLAEREFVVITARDRSQRLWTSALWGAPGFLAAHGSTLTVDAVPSADDPLADLAPGQPVGLIAIEFATRRRVRVDQAYGNCPQYIQQRTLTVEAAGAPAAAAVHRDGLTAADADLIRAADTFFFGTIHPGRGADASHRGGTTGFVRVEGPDLWWPDYPGNNMFNSLGNLAVDDSAALLFVDFAGGRALHLSGTAAVQWTALGVAGDDGATGRRVRMHIENVAESSLPVHAGGFTASPYNPPLS